MQRSIYNNLLLWKDKEDRKPLILLGARQVGKTFILKEFGRNEFKNTVYINCHNNDFTRDLFRDFNISRIIRNMESFSETKITIGETLVILDEIQEVDNGIASLKYFCEDCRDLHIAVAGSLLGLSLRENESYPVGKVETLKMFPMSFEEYLLARGREKLLETLRETDWDSLNSMHETLVEYLREYYFVGGMPEAVKTYIETQDEKKVRAIQSEIIDAYERDISKHTKPQAQRIHQLWDCIPAQLAKENKKFIFGAIKKGSRAADFEIALQWLSDAGLIYKVERVKEVAAPLKFYADYSAFKVYLLDCGLLACMSELAPKDILLGSKAFVEFKGAFTENFVLQQLKAIPETSVYYFSKENSSQEIDFLLQSAGKIVPIEVKAAENVQSKSLSVFINEDHKDKHFKGLRISLKPYIDQGWMENIPLYSVESFLKMKIQSEE